MTTLGAPLQPGRDDEPPPITLGDVLFLLAFAAAVAGCLLSEW